MEWTKEFIQICEREDEKRENRIAHLATSLQITPQITSTPRMRTSQSNTSQLTQLLATLTNRYFSCGKKLINSSVLMLYNDVYKADNDTCFQINCLLAEVTHVILWSNRYNRVDKYPLY